VFNQFGDLERCTLRPGNFHSAGGWEAVLRPVLARYSAKVRPSITRRRFRANAAFVEFASVPVNLLEAEGWDYAIRIKGSRSSEPAITGIAWKNALSHASLTGGRPYGEFWLSHTRGPLRPIGPKRLSARAGPRRRRSTDWAIVLTRIPNIDAASAVCRNMIISYIHAHPDHLIWD
jgi:hypothetical protein